MWIELICLSNVLIEHDAAALIPNPLDFSLPMEFALFCQLFPYPKEIESKSHPMASLLSYDC